ncbi:MAG: hypothetical protein RRA92_06450 [Gemmatimonadota bacterium]|nr:hypothetical protein [Gemmatimonadota bacterium]
MARAAAILELERAIERLGARPAASGPVAPTGVPGLDALLPGGGLPRGRLVEWLGRRSSGRTALLRAGLARLRATGESVAWIDAGRTLYAPDWSALVAGPGEFWVVRPRDGGEAAWCADLLLRSGAFGAVVLQAGGDGSAGRAGKAGRAGRGAASLRGTAAVRLQRLAEEAGALLVTLDEAPVAALRLGFRPGRVEPLRDVPFGPFLPSARPVWVRVGKRGSVEVPVLCPFPVRPTPARRRDGAARDRKGPE